MGRSEASWLQGIFSPFIKSHPPAAPGTVWASHNAEYAFLKGAMNSQESGRKVRVAFRNQTTLPLILSWVTENGTPHHFYTLKPAEVLEGPVTALDHVENTYLGHAFCVAYVGENESTRKDGLLDPKCVIGGYRPDFISKAVKDDDKSYVHLVSISQKPAKKIICCAPGLRGSPECGNDIEGLCWVVEAKESRIDGKQINTCNKFYQEAVLGGWPVRLEPDWHGGNEELERRLAMDLQFAANCLPEHAREFLRENTPVYVNKSLHYGPDIRPVTARGLCFHPEKDWLEEHFMASEKCECVEIYCAQEYLEFCELWGCAGVLLHEFCHAYHHKLTEDGYKNKEIQECYDQAMKDRLYDWVRVHGPQGPMAKAYACNNAMEYFAELSAAFLGQPDLTSEEEFNKWYPFNRRQIKEHDPRAHDMLKKIWKMDD